MADMNFACFTGRFGADPEVKETHNGTKVCNISIAVGRPKSPQGELVTDWIECVFWKKQAEFIEKYGNKGKRIWVSGSINIEEFKDKDTGKKRTKAKLIVSKCGFIGDKEREKTGFENAEQKYEPTEFSEILDAEDELPF